MLPWQNLCCPSHVSSTDANQSAVFFYMRPLRCCWAVSVCTDVLRKELQSKKRVAMKVVPCRPRDSIGVILLPTLLL